MLDFTKNYTLMEVAKEAVPSASFFKDRYFPTGAGDIFNSDKVLVEYKKGDRRLAPFVAPRVGDIPVDRIGYSVKEIEPSYIAPSRVMSIDDLAKRGFGEALYPGMTPDERAATITRDDLTDLENRIGRREEWLAVQTMLRNACEMTEYIDAKTVGETKFVAFYESESDHIYTVAKKWDEADHDICGDIEAMCQSLAERGLNATDLILGVNAAKAFKADENIKAMINTTSGINFGSINETIAYPGVVKMATLNFGGFLLNVFVCHETYVNEEGTSQLYLPADKAIVTYPSCGHTIYGAITQIDYGSTEFTTYAAKRVTKLTVDQNADVKKIRLGTRPITVPHSYCPFIVATVL